MIGGLGGAEYEEQEVPDARQNSPEVVDEGPCPDQRHDFGCYQVACDRADLSSGKNQRAHRTAFFGWNPFRQQGRDAGKQRTLKNNLTLHLARSDFK